jgi:hypothetical protein
MQVAARPYVLAAAAVAATSFVAVTPVVSQVGSQAAKLPVKSYETKLVDESIANIPINLFDDLINIPANELYATQFATDNLFMAGPWFVVSPTNLWGVDPGDPTHFMTVTNFLLPFPELSGMDSPETDFAGGLGQQLWGFIASELPTSAGCDEVDCAPFEPASPVTGISDVDFFVWLDEALTGQEKIPLFEYWFDAQYNSDGQFTFNPDAPGSVDPSGTITDPNSSLPVGTVVTTGQVHPFEGWSGISTAGDANGTGGLLGGEGIPGTGAADGDLGYYMPWSGDTYTFSPQTPIDNFFASLMETPSTTGLDGTGIDPIYGDPTEILQTFQSLLAGLMMFDPFTPGSPFCPDQCTAIVDAHLDYPDLIQDINNWTPGGNPVINEWLADYYDTTVNGVSPAPDGGANVPTEATIQNSIFLLQNHDFWDFGNPPYTGENTGPTDIGTQYPAWQAFWQSLGLNTTNETDAQQLTGLEQDVTPQAFQADLATLTAGFSEQQLSADWSALATAFEPGTLAADWSALLAGLGL